MKLKLFILAAFSVAALALVPAIRAEVVVNYSATEIPADLPGSDLVEGVLSAAASIFGSKFASVFTLLATISGICALTIKPLWDKFVFPGLTAYVQSTASQKDDAWLAAFLSNRVTKAVLYVLNLLSHIKIPIIDKDGAAVSPSSASTTLPSS